MSTDIVQYLIYGEHIPDLIIVSPAYGDKNSTDYGGSNQRNRDFMPFAVKGIDDTPGAVNDLEFFRQELIPFVESTYRIDSRDRTIEGYSLGAFFVVFVLFQNPGLFNRFIIGEQFHERFFELEEHYANENNHLPVRLWAGALPDKVCMRLSELVEKIKSRNYPDFQGEFEFLIGRGHFTAAAEALTNGLLSVYRK